MTNKTFLHDNFHFRRQSLLTTTQPLDATNFTNIHGFNVAGVQPADSQRKFVFTVNDENFIFSGSTPISFDYEINLENVLKYGNTAAEIAAVNNVSSWAGQKIYPIIALDCAADSNVAPSVRLSLNVSPSNDIFSKSVISPVFAAKEKFKFKDFRANATLSGNASANFQIRRQNENVWGSWESFQDAKFKTADSFQLRANLAVTSLNGADSAKINSVSVELADGDNLCVDSFEIVSSPLDAGDNLATAYALVRHSFLDDKNISAFVCFSSTLEEKNVTLGTGNGSTQNFTLPDTDFDFSTLTVQLNGKNICDFYFNSNSNSISVTAPQGDIVTANYFCGAVEENWLEMDKQFTFFDQNFDQNVWTSRFVYRLDSALNSQIVKIKFAADSGVQIFSTASGFSFD